MQIDPRGQRFAAAITTVVLAIALVTSNVWVVGFQAVVFAIAAFIGLQASPYGWLYKKLVRPRLGPPAELEDARPPRFAQLVGFVFATVATLGFATGVDLVGTVATALALGAAFLNAAFGFCLGCEIYLLARRVTHRSTPSTTPAAAPAASNDTNAAAPAASKEVSA